MCAPYSPSVIKGNYIELWYNKRSRLMSAPLALWSVNDYWLITTLSFYDKVIYTCNIHQTFSLSPMIICSASMALSLSFICPERLSQFLILRMSHHFLFST